MSTAPAANLVGSTSAVPGNVTIESQSSLPFTVPDDILYEVVDGKIVEKEMGARQAEIAGILAQYLGTFARTHRLGRALIEFIFRIDQAKNLQRRPDVAFVAHARWPVTGSPTRRRMRPAACCCSIWRTRPMTDRPSKCCARPAAPRNSPISW